jgi:hypothetical protein
MPNNLSSKASNIAIGALQSIPFENLIGGPLEASVHAQSLAAQSTIDFIQAVGTERCTSSRRQRQSGKR